MAFTEYYADAAASGAGTGLNPTDAWTTIAAAISGIGAGPASSSTRINIKVNASPYAQTTNTRTFNTAGAATAPVWWRGYKATIGDQDANNVAVANTDIPQITFTTGQMVISGAHQIFSNIDISSACTTTGGAVSVSGACQFYGFRSQNTAASSAGRALTNSSIGSVFTRCYFKATTTATTLVTSTGTGDVFNGCVFTSGIAGVNCTNGPHIFNFCIFDSQAGDAVATTSGVVTLTGCTFYNGGGNGVNFITTVAGAGNIINNCYFEGFLTAAKYAINNSTGANTDLVRCTGNSFYNNTATYGGMGDNPALFDNGTLASSGLTAPGSQTFTPLPILYALGFPGKFETISAYQGYLDGGAVQHQASGGPTGLIMRVTGQYSISN